MGVQSRMNWGHMLSAIWGDHSTRGRGPVAKAGLNEGRQGGSVAGRGRAGHGIP